MTDNYWVEFWKEYTSDLEGKDEQSQVLRTFNKEPISEDLWVFTLQKVDEDFPVKRGNKVLDLCSGNGLLSKHFVSKGASVVAVDVSSQLLKNLEGEEDVEVIISDIRKLNFENETFDHILIYAGIQYLSESESIILIQQIYSWLKPNGVLFIGDIPNVDKKWNFYNTEDRQKVYFNNILEGKSIVGNWFSKEWYDHLKSFVGFKTGKFVPQDEKLIYASFRFDYVFKK